MRDQIKESTLQPLGNLSLLPREIRDEIYRQVLSKMHQAFYSCSLVESVVHVQPDRCTLSLIKGERGGRTKSGLSILRLSKAIKDEAMPLLYSAVIFLFSYYINPFPPRRTFDVDITTRMTNIVVSYDIPSELEKTPDATMVGNVPMGLPMGHVAGRPGDLAFFQGASITRKSILVNLRLCELWTHATDMTHLPLLEAVKQFTGFKTVIVRITAVIPRKTPARGSSEAATNKSLDVGRWEKLYAGLEPLLIAMSEALEPTLGNSSPISEHGSEDLARVQRHITFHPQNHLAAISKAKIEEMNTQ